MKERAARENIVDMLVTRSPVCSFFEQVQALGLSADLEQKCLQADWVLHSGDLGCRALYLTRENEQELATEVLLKRHRFTCLVAENRFFRQAALTVIQNIYLCKERKIFFTAFAPSAEKERQAALHLFSQPTDKVSVPLEKTLQHLILARIWERVLYKADQKVLDSAAFRQLNDVVLCLNTLRNIYMLLTTRLVAKITAGIHATYRQSITREDAYQIGSFGVARAAYRYHPSFGVRFSTYASRWIFKEIQRQALDGRLIRVSATLIERIAKAKRENNRQKEEEAAAILTKAFVALGALEDSGKSYAPDDPVRFLEQKEMAERVCAAVDAVLSAKSADIIKRRYGIGQYQGGAQSILAISEVYGVTRGSIYQREKKALHRLRQYFTVQASESAFREFFPG